MSWSRISWGRLVAIIMKALKIAAISLVVAVTGLFLIAITLLLLPMLWGESFLDRPAPSKDGYISSHMQCFDRSQIENVDFVWHGAIGGIMTVGRAKFKGPVKLEDAMVEEKVKAGKFTIGTYDPAKMTEGDKLLLKQQLTVVTHGEMPSWLDFPFDRIMRTIREAADMVPGVHPRYETIWYIDDEHNVVYIYHCWG
jgi:hypothetical protein